MHPVEVAVNIELQQWCRVIRRAPSRGGLNIKPQVRQIEGVNKGVDHANRVVLGNPVFQAFWQ